MTLQEKQARLVEDFSIIENPLERFSVIVEHYRKLPPLPAPAQTEEHRVPGCVSQVWVAGGPNQGVCQFQSEADSPILQGVVRLLTDFYTGASPQEVVDWEPTFLEALRITDQLSTTRRNGLRHVRTRLIALALASA